MASRVEDATAVEKLVIEAARHGWSLMLPELHPHAGGDQHYVAYLENDDGFESELVESSADETSTPRKEPAWQHRSAVAPS